MLKRNWPKPSSSFNHGPFPKRQILDSSKPKEFADDNFKFDKNCKNLSKWTENTVGKKEKLLVTSNFTFSQCFQNTCTSAT